VIRVDAEGLFSLYFSASEAYRIVRSLLLTFALPLALTITIGGASPANARIRDEAACGSLAARLAQFLSKGEPANGNPLFAALSRCADRRELAALLDALARPTVARRPAEIAAAIESALRSPNLAGDQPAQLIAERLRTVRDPDARVALAYLLGWRNAAQALNRTLRDDSAAEVRAAAAVALRNCQTPPDFTILWQAARTDPDAEVRAAAYQTLDRFGQLHTAAELLAASRAQTQAASAGRFLSRWLRAEDAPAQQTADTLTRLAEQTGSIQASSALAAILDQMPAAEMPVVKVLRPSPPLPPAGGSARAAVMAPVAPPAIGNAASEKAELRRALLQHRQSITRAALAQFAASRKMPEDAARMAIDCALAVNQCGRGGCPDLAGILHVTDRMDAPLALEASHDISVKVGGLYFARRHLQYSLMFAAAVLIGGLVLLAGRARGNRRIVAIGAGWLLIVAAAAALQFASGSITGARVWPPLRLWPATALGSIATAIAVAVALTLALGWERLLPAALIAGELAWWVVPALLAAAGVTLTMQHYSNDEDWIPFLLAFTMPIAAPVLTLVISAAAQWVAKFMAQPKSNP